jgi:uncharacterized phage protein (TIGR01671 family)
MSREILFRGKIKLPDGYRGHNLPYQNGDWIYGLMNSNESIRGIFVDTDTIGQYTGITDKNGVKIFDGDIVRIGRYFNNNFYTEDNYVCKYDINTASFKFYYVVPKDIADVNKYAILGDGATLSDMGCGFTINVIGNICDNPELLQENSQ